ncbi:MAG: hypothetical protein J6Z49_11720, partial [Kiritimatiellae bacterium]|nr:hypothetical protein [Kiritimatiellia bacterium]
TAEFAQNRTPDKLAPQQNPIKSKGLHLLRQSCFENYTSPVLKTTRQGKMEKCSRPSFSRFISIDLTHEK